MNATAKLIILRVDKKRLNIGIRQGFYGVKLRELGIRLCLEGKNRLSVSLQNTREECADNFLNGHKFKKKSLCRLLLK